VSNLICELLIFFSLCFVQIVDLDRFVWVDEIFHIVLTKLNLFILQLYDRLEPFALLIELLDLFIFFLKGVLQSACNCSLHFRLTLIRFLIIHDISDLLDQLLYSGLPVAIYAHQVLNYSIFISISLIIFFFLFSFPILIKLNSFSINFVQKYLSLIKAFLDRLSLITLTTRIGSQKFMRTAIRRH